MTTARAPTTISSGFTRYALRLQYHGGSFLGFSAQKDEDCIVVNSNGATTDLRGYTSVESRLVKAFRRLLNNKHSPLAHSFENLQVSSRTDRGVHALGNTFHIDISDDRGITPRQLHAGLNYYLARESPLSRKRSAPTSTEDSNETARELANRRLRGATLYPMGDVDDPEWVRHSPAHDVRILSAKVAPETMINHRVNPPELIDWNARYSATQRTYAYRILHYVTENHDDPSSSMDWAAPFEWDRAWRIRDRRPLDVEAMRNVSSICFTGEQDFSSFQSKGCQRSTPVVDMERIHISTHPYGMNIPEQLGQGRGGSGLLGLGFQNCSNRYQLVTILFQGNSFLYRQVRNMVGCLVEVGRGGLDVDQVLDITASKDRRKAPAMAPPQGLFLVDVKHGDFYF